MKIMRSVVLQFCCLTTLLCGTSGAPSSSRITLGDAGVSLFDINERLQRIEDKVFNEDRASKCAVESYCEEEWTLFNDKCYFLSLDRENNENARTMCSEMGAYLVEISTDAENTFVHDSAPHKDIRIWLGIERSGENGWAYIHSECTPAYMNWSGGEPSDKGSDEDCVEMLASSGMWNDLPCDERREYMCEKPAVKK